MNHYEILGISRTATPQEIKKAYKKQCLLHHPDKTHNSDEMFKKISNAYETLSDEIKRKDYDRTLSPIKTSLPREVSSRDYFKDTSVSIIDDFLFNRNRKPPASASVIDDFLSNRKAKPPASVAKKPQNIERCKWINTKGLNKGVQCQKEALKDPLGKGYCFHHM